MSLASVNAKIQELTTKRNDLKIKVNDIVSIINDINNFINITFTPNREAFIKEYNYINRVGASWSWEGKKVNEFKDLLNVDIKKNYANQANYYSSIKSQLTNKKVQFNNEINSLNSSISYWKRQKELLLKD